MMRIPKIIHQTWKTSDVSPGLQQLALSWQKYHPGWEYRLWTDEMNHAFVAENYPELLQRYNAYPTAIQRVDAVRYMILHQQGGVFVDLDFECLKNIEPLLAEHSCVLGCEPDEHCRIHNKTKIISNAFMASVPGHSLLETVLRELKEYDRHITHRFDRVLESTGPFMLTRVYEQLQQKEDVAIMPANLLYPLSKRELELNILPGEEAYAVHYYNGSWWKSSL